MKKVIFKLILFIPVALIMTVAQALSLIPWIKDWAIRKVCFLEIDKYQKEMYLVTLSEMPYHKEIERWGRITLKEMEQIDLKISLWLSFFRIKELDYRDTVNLLTLKG